MIDKITKELFKSLLALLSSWLPLLLIGWALLSLSSCMFFGSDGDIEIDPMLPAWFWDMPQEEGVRFAVGYSPAFKDSPHAFNDAFLDAARRLWTDDNSRLICVKGMISTRYGLRNLENENIVLRDTTGFAQYCGTLVRLDSISSPDQRLILVSTRPCAVDKSRIRCPQDQPDTPSDSFIWGCGIASRYHRLSNTWIEAEGQARIQIGLAFADVEGLTKTKLTDAGRIETYASHEVFRLSSDVHLIGISTVRRRLDPKSHSLQVWARGRVREAR